MNAPAPEILDCTLRDGSYVVDFQFSPSDTALISQLLESAGVRLVEVGHGLGLRASLAGKGRAAATDAQYMAVMSSSLTKAAWGMFCIPGIARLEDLELAASMGMGFVRVGTNVSSAEQAEPYLKKANALGLRVFANMMKSYVLPPRAVAETARRLADQGAQGVYLVDSAGCMVSPLVGEYVSEIRARVDVPVGFHGHDNLHLAVANSLAAWEAGAGFIDTTLQGIGRGGGNAATEVIVALLARAGAPTGIDLNKLLDTSGALLERIPRETTYYGLNIIAGLHGFHSSFLHDVLAQARCDNIDPRELIEAVCASDKVNPSRELIQVESERIAARSREGGAAMAFSGASLGCAGPKRSGRLFRQQLEFLGTVVCSRARLTGGLAVVNVYAKSSASLPMGVSEFVQESEGYAIGSVSADKDELPQIFAALDAFADWFFVDSRLVDPGAEEGRRELGEGARADKALAYNHVDVLARSVAAQAAHVLAGRGEVRVLLCDANPMTLRTVLALAGLGLNLRLFCRDGGVEESVARLAGAGLDSRVVFGQGGALSREGQDADLVLSFEPGGVDASVIAPLGANTPLFDGCIGALSPEALSLAHAKGLAIMRPDMRACLVAELHAALLSRRILSGSGRGEFAGFPAVAGGMVGRKGDLVLDSLASPTQVIGVADGRGLVLHDDPEFSGRMRQAESAVLNLRVRARY